VLGPRDGGSGHVHCNGGVGDGRGDATLDDDPAEPAAGGGCLVVFKRVVVGADRREELDVPLGDVT